jgi:AraC-like DNA-binding protein
MFLISWCNCLKPLAAGRNVSVKEVTLRLSYADYPYIIALFKEQWRESPGRYRKLVGDPAYETGFFPGTGEEPRELR